jgi:hypothetical protein
MAIHSIKLIQETKSRKCSFTEWKYYIIEVFYCLKKPTIAMLQEDDLAGFYE